MAYSDKVLDHFNNPRNVGSLDKNDPQVGTGLAGAPECFHGDTLIATADGNRIKSLKEIFETGETIPVWSCNLTTKQIEIKEAKAIYTGPKEMDEIELSDGGKIKVTNTHEFLLRPTYQYLNNSLIGSESIRPFRRYVDKRGYWRLREINNYEYQTIFSFINPTFDLVNKNIHHKDHNKQNDRIVNLEPLLEEEHIKEHKPDMNGRKIDLIDKDIIINALEKNEERAAAADYLGITTDVLYDSMRIHGIQTQKKALPKEIYEMHSQRMKANNPYKNFSVEQKLAFARHTGSSNGRWKDISNEQLLDKGYLLYQKEGKFTTAIWCEFAKKEGLPQNLKGRFESFADFKFQVIQYNHKIIKRTSQIGIFDAYTLQVEQNNNYVVITRITKNINEGIFVKNCGDVMKLQIKVIDGIITDAKFKTFGCGSAISASSLATEMLKGKSLEEAEKFKNTVLVEALSLPPVKIHCSVLAEDAIRAAVADYRAKLTAIKPQSAESIPEAAAEAPKAGSDFKT